MLLLLLLRVLPCGSIIRVSVVVRVCVNEQQQYYLAVVIAWAVILLVVFLTAVALAEILSVVSYSSTGACGSICCVLTCVVLSVVLSAVPCRSSISALGSVCRSSCCACSCGAPTVVQPPRRPAAWTLRLHLSRRSGDAAAGPPAGGAGTATAWWTGPWLRGDAERQVLHLVHTQSSRQHCLKNTNNSV